MLVALVGPTCSGKSCIADYLVEQHGFRRVRVASKDQVDQDPTHAGALAFPTAAALLDWATIHWSENNLIENPFEELEEQDGFRKRPFFLLISLNAPALTRYSRHCARKGLSSVDQGKALLDFLSEDDARLFGQSRSLVAESSQSEKLSRVEDSAGVIANMNSLNISEVRSSEAQEPAVNGNLTAKEPRNVKGGRPTVSDLMFTADLKVTNAFPTLAVFREHLSSLNLTSKQRLRPSWDTYFLSLCTLASLRSNCMKRRVGAVLVRNNRVLSTGYNGTPRGLRNCNEGGCARCNGRLASAESNGASPMKSKPVNGQIDGHAPEPDVKVALIKSGVSLEECLCLHAEENALLECGRERGGAEGTVLYCNTCAVKIVQTGVQEVVYQLEYSMDDRSREIFKEAGVVFRKYIPPV